MINKILIAITLFVMVSCVPEQNKTFEVTYKVHYPSEVKTYKRKIKANQCCHSYSRNGSNVLSSSGGAIEITSAPIEYISHKEIK